MEIASLEGQPSAETHSSTTSSDSDAIYERAEQYWASVSSDIDGMLGGFGTLHRPDIVQSRHFITTLKSKVSLATALHSRFQRLLRCTERAVDCGCGIGRVSKHLLVPLFQSVDMVDVTESFIAKSIFYLGDANAKIRQRFVKGLQDFHPESGYYDVIWIQWVSGHLTDEDFTSFFQRCKAGIRSGGCVVLKENLCSSETSVWDGDDHSWTRPRSLVLELVAKAGLQLVAEKKQTNFPAGMYEVRMFAFQ